MSDGTQTQRLPCGYCDGYAEYDGGMVRINDEPACRDCVTDLTGGGGE